MQYKIPYWQFIQRTKYKLAALIIFLAVLVYITGLRQSESNSIYTYLFYTSFVIAFALLLQLEPFFSHRTIYRFLQSEEMKGLINIQELNTLFNTWHYKVVVKTSINRLDTIIGISTTFSGSGKKHYVDIQMTTDNGMIKKDYQIHLIKELKEIIIRLKKQYN